MILKKLTTENTQKTASFLTRTKHAETRPPSEASLKLPLNILGDHFSLPYYELAEDFSSSLFAKSFGFSPVRGVE